MMGYTHAVIAGMIVILLLDQFLLRTRIITLHNKRLWKTTAVFVVFQLVFDNYFTAKELWVFNPTEVIGIFLPFIPIENIFFGIVLLWLSIILYTFTRTA